MTLGVRLGMIEGVEQPAAKRRRRAYAVSGPGQELADLTVSVSLAM